MSKMNKLKSKLEAMHPDKRRKLYLISAVVTFLVVISAIVLINDDPASRQPKKKVAQEEESVSNLLMGTEGREIGLQGVSNDVQALRSELDELRKANARRELGGAGSAPTSPADPDAALESLSQQVGAERGTIGPPGTVFNTDRPTSPPPTARLPEPQPVPPLRQNQVVTPPPVPAAPQIQSAKDESPKVSAAAKRLRNVYLPSGSMMTGMLLTGLDAPTGRGAQSTPIPVVIRVKHEAILPSQYRSDVREAFILAAGFGDLSSERAYLRAEKFSMILRSGEVIDLPIKMSAVGNDGKSGLRGRLVSKQGAVIGKALLAGMADGVSRAFGNGGGIGFGSDGLPSNQDMVVSGIGGGTTGALDRIASYFLQQAEAMYPVIEVDGGREVTFILLEGLELMPRTVEGEEDVPSTAVAAAD